MRNVTRRSLLRGLGLGFALLAGRFAWPRAVHANVGPGGDLDRLLEQVRASRPMGRAYLSDHPDEGDLRFLVRAIFGDLAWETRDVRELRCHVIERTRRDFEAGDVVSVADWIIGRTEARLFALSFMRR